MRLIAAIAACLLILTGVYSTGPAQAQKNTDQLVIGITQFPSTFHPNIDAMLAKTYILAMTRRPFTSYDKDWKLVCMLCVTLPTIENGLAHTRYVMLAKVANKETRTVVSALIKQARKLPIELYKSLTWDRGKELADHRRFTLATDIDVYFCDPQSPWQRGSNENTNGLLRQYFPKGTDLSVYSQAHLNKVARQLNERPRKTLEFETPAERFNACVASTG